MKASHSYPTFFARLQSGVDIDRLFQGRHVNGVGTKEDGGKRDPPSTLPSLLPPKKAH